MVWFLDVTLMERRRDAKVPRAAWEEFLREGSAPRTGPTTRSSARCWRPTASMPKTRPAAKFLLDRDLEPNTRHARPRPRSSSAATCSVPSATTTRRSMTTSRSDYYGIQAFLNRSFLFPNAEAADRGHRREGRRRRELHERLRQGQEVEHDAAAHARRQGRSRSRSPRRGRNTRSRRPTDVRPVPTYSRRAKLAARHDRARQPGVRPQRREPHLGDDDGPRHRPPRRHGPRRQPAVAPRTARPARRGVRRPQVRREVAGAADRAEPRPTSGRASFPTGLEEVPADRYLVGDPQAADARAVRLRRPAGDRPDRRRTARPSARRATEAQLDARLAAASRAVPVDVRRPRRANRRTGSPPRSTRRCS